MKQRFLILGGEHFAAARVQEALQATDWAIPVPWTGPPETLSESALAGYQGVFNGTMGNHRTILSTAQALYNALKRAQPQIRVVHLSSMTVYGSFSGEALESTPSRADLGAYGAAQIEAEVLASQYPQSVILRPGCEYGPHCPEWSERIARLLQAHRLGDLGAAGDGVCNLLFVDDLVAAVLAAFRTPGIDGERFNLAMRSPPTWNEYFVQFGKALGAIPISRIGRRRLKLEVKLLAPPLKVLELIDRRLRKNSRSIPPPITPSLLQLCAQTVRLNAAKAEQALGLQWTPLQEGLRRAAATFHGT